MTSPALLAAFLATTYRVTTPSGVFNLRIGVSDPAFDQALRIGLSDTLPVRSDEPQAIEWAIITACNPGKQLDDQENAVRQRRLAVSIADNGWQHWPAANIADDGQWPVEASFLLLQVDPLRVRALARQFGQLAVVLGRQGLAPRLSWLEGGEGNEG